MGGGAFELPDPSTVFDLQFVAESDPQLGELLKEYDVSFLPHDVSCTCLVDIKRCEDVLPTCLALSRNATCVRCLHLSLAHLSTHRVPILCAMPPRASGALGHLSTDSHRWLLRAAGSPSHFVMLAMTGSLGTLHYTRCVCVVPPSWVKRTLCMCYSISLRTSGRNIHICAV